MANTVVKIKRTSTAGKVPNTVNLPNAGELALNMTDGILYSTNGSNIFEIGANNTTTRVSNSISVGANLVINTSTFFVGNSTVNTTITSSQITNDIAQLDVAVYVGDNVDITTTGLTIGNSSINTAINSSSLSIRGIIANGTLGTDGQVLHSNGSATYWAADDNSGTVTSVATGSGLSGGPITTTGTVSVLANNGITANSTGLFVTQGTGAVVNASGVHVNATYIGTLTANNTSFVGTVSAANVVSNAQLSANLGNYVTTTNLTNNLANYQTTAGLSANVATLTANNANNLGGVAAASYVQNTDSRTLSGNLVFSGANVSFSGNVGIGTSSPTAKLTVVDENNSGWRYEQYNDLDGTNYRNYRARGTISSPTAVLSGDRLASFFGAGYGVTAGFSAPNGGMSIRAAENFTGSSAGTYVTFSTATLGTNPGGGGSERMRISANGNIGIGNTTPEHLLRVQGDISLSGGIHANGSFGTAGEVLHSNGTATYWAADDAGTSGVTSVASGSGLTGGPITSTGTLSVLANNGITANSTGLFVTQGTGVVVNASGVHVNSTYIGTLTANNTSFVGTVSAANVVSNAQLSANLGNYQTTAGLSANVATLTANNATNLGGVAAASYVQNTDTRTLSGNLSFSGANVNFTGNLRITGGLIANGLLGSAGQVLHSNGTATYWAIDDNSGTVTSVATGSGLTGGPITATGTVSVLANNGVTANSTGLFVTQGTGTVVNATGVHVNATYIATLTANNSTNLNDQPASFYTNATNITTGTLPYAQIPANIVNTTAAFTRSGVTTFSANIVLGSSGLSANGSFGTAGHVLHSNGTATYWAVDDAGGSTISVVANTTSATFYPVFVAGTGDQNPSIRTTATAFTFNPSTSALAIGGTMSAVDFNSTSDIKLKTNIEPLSSPLSTLMQVNAYSFTWKSDNTKTLGVIAQEVEKILPELVHEQDGNLTVKYNGLVALLIESVKEQQKQIDFLMTKISKG